MKRFGSKTLLITKNQLFMSFKRSKNTLIPIIPKLNIFVSIFIPHSNKSCNSKYNTIFYIILTYIHKRKTLCLFIRPTNQVKMNLTKNTLLVV